MREEVRTGRTPITAIDAGFTRALATIRDEGGDVRIEEGRERAREAGVDGSNGSAAGADLLTDTLVDEHVAVDRDSDREHDADDARQSERCIEQREDAEDHAHVDGDGDAGKNTEQSVRRHHEDDDERGAEIGRELASLDRILAEAPAHPPLLHHANLARHRAAPKT